VNVGIFEAGAGVTEGLREEFMLGLEAVNSEDDVALFLEVSAVASDVSGDAPVIQLGGGIEEDIVGGGVSLQDLEEPGGEDHRYVRRKSFGGGVELGAIRALTRTLVSSEALDLGVVFLAAADPACFEVDPLFHGDLEVRGLTDVGNVPFGWHVIILDGFFMGEELVFQALNAATKCRLMIHLLFFMLGDGGTEPGNEFSEGILADVVKGHEGADCCVGGNRVSCLYVWHVVGGARVGSRFVSGRGVHVEEVLQKLVGSGGKDVVGVCGEWRVGEVEVFKVSSE
jgi:hypothetical protein